MVQGPALTLKGNMKKFTIEVSHAAPGQLLSIAAELKIMSNNWGALWPPDHDQRPEAASSKPERTKDQAPSFKLQASQYNRIRIV